MPAHRQIRTIAIVKPSGPEHWLTQTRPASPASEHILVGQYILHWLKAAASPRRRGTPRWGPTLRAAPARRPRARHRTPRPQLRERRPGPVPEHRSLPGQSVPSTALMTAGAGACLSAASPSRHPCDGSPLRTRARGLHTGIAAGHHRAPHPRGHCRSAAREHVGVGADVRGLQAAGPSGGPTSLFCARGERSQASGCAPSRGSRTTTAVSVGRRAA